MIGPDGDKFSKKLTLKKDPTCAGSSLLRES